MKLRQNHMVKMPSQNLMKLEEKVLFRTIKGSVRLF